jgi:hypothetical protein
MKLGKNRMPLLKYIFIQLLLFVFVVKLMTNPKRILHKHNFLQFYAQSETYTCIIYHYSIVLL